jgi:uncharacterized protein YceH (UPF0502 family)
MPLEIALDPVEARLLGVLIEKELTTPDQYPLSLNALAVGSNQKSNRDPVLELSESDVRAGLERLRRHALVGVSHASGARVEKYRHAAADVLALERPELAVLAELLLRGAQMPGELRGRASRMSPIETLADLERILEGLRSKGLVIRLDPKPGSRSVSWDQLIATTSGSAFPRATDAAHAAPERSVQAEASSAPPAKPAAIERGSPLGGGLESRVAALEREVARLAQLYEQLARPT